jgi:hypothetical protein
MSKMAGGGIPWPQTMANTTMPKYTSTELFEVYHTHTKDCKVCSRGKPERDQLTAYAYIAIPVYLRILDAQQSVAATPY